MTYRNDFPLAERMKNRFSGRGASVSGMRASSTSELMKRAQMGGDPSVNCSELDFRNGNVTVNRRGNGRPNPQARSPYVNDPQRVARSGGSPSGARPQTRSTSAGGTRSGERERTASAKTGVKRAQTVRKPSATAKKKGGNVKKATGKKENNVLRLLKKLKAQPAGGPEEITEVRAESRRMTPMFAVFVVVGMLMIMSIVVSFSESYQTTTDIAMLENTLANLKDTATDLELRLEEKNDIRDIERIATEELGMVNEDAVQRKYLSLSDGERIDLIEDPAADTETHGMGVLLSSFWSSLGSFFDYFR